MPASVAFLEAGSFWIKTLTDLTIEGFLPDLEMTIWSLCPYIVAGEGRGRNKTWVGGRRKERGIGEVEREYLPLIYLILKVIYDVCVCILVNTKG